MATESSTMASGGGSDSPTSLIPLGSVAGDSEKDRQNFTEVSRRLENAERGLRTFWEFLKPYRTLVGPVFVLGVLLALVNDMVLAPTKVDPTSWISLFRNFLSHMAGWIAHGLIVSSVCVFGLEYLREARGDFKRTEKMNGLIVSLDKAVRALGEVAQTNKVLAAFHCFSKTEAERILAKSLNGIIKHASELKQTFTVDSQLYIEFLGWLCNWIQGNAQSLALLEQDRGKETFSDELDDWDSQPWHATYEVSWPTSQEVAARISAIKMKGLGAGDFYSAVSNVLFWNKEQMDFLMTQTEKACNERGVTVRRIFNLCNLIYVPGLLEQKFEVAKRIVGSHLELQMRTNGKYEARFFGPNQVEKAFKANPEINRHSLFCTAFAIFNRTDNGERDIVRYRTKDVSLSQMSLGRADVSKYCDRFELMWDLCEGVPNPFSSNMQGFKDIMGNPITL